ncbi:MAG TPA: UDP-N-acetylglucosamine 1-carboxyvinyltransferase [Spirochaetota bacterium]
MDYYHIQGGLELHGSVKISGAKNAALPIIVASLLADGTTVLRNVPDLADIRTIIHVIEFLGAKTRFDHVSNTLTIDVNGITNALVPYDIVKTMRASVYVLGPLLGRLGEADVSLPGGCAIGERPVDIHLSGFETLGAEIDLDGGYIKARTKENHLVGNTFKMRQISVGATANLLMGAVLAKGETILENCALEPDIIDLGEFLIKMGAKIEGLGTDRITITGVKTLSPVTYDIMPDRIEAGTYLLAGAATRGNVTIENIIPQHIDSLTDTLEAMGFDITKGKSSVSIKPGKSLKGALVRTLPYPGFPTDLQAPMMALMITIPGISVMIETIFENRFTHVPEMRRLGANISIEREVSIIQGMETLSGAPVQMSDLRAGAALVIAALTAKGESEIRRIYHSDRGYEHFADKLTSLGAKIERKKGGNL